MEWYRINFTKFPNIKFSALSNICLFIVMGIYVKLKLFDYLEINDLSYKPNNKLGGLLGGGC